jgi:proteasome accessory factor B
VVTVDPAFGPLAAAARDRQAVTFAYRTPEDDAPRERRLRPWGVVCWRGRWYVVGHDLDRAAERCFRLSRVVGAVRRVGPPGSFTPPAGLDLISYVARWSGPVERHRRARLLVRQGRAAGLRRLAERVTPGEPYDEVVLRFADPEWLAGYLVGYGPDVVVAEPPEVRDRVVARLREILTRPVAGSPPAPEQAPGGARPAAAARGGH